MIDKETFIKKNRSILENHFYKFQDVKYSLFNTPDDDEINYEADTSQEFIKNNWESLFFLKHKDWENEDEHRLFIMDFDGKFSIDDLYKGGFYKLISWDFGVVFEQVAAQNEGA